MEQFESAEQILDFAIAREEEAAEGYRRLAQQSEYADLRRLFEEFAQEEVIHREKLMLVKTQKLLLPAQDRLVDLRIKDYTTEGTPGHEGDYQQALLFAIRKEKAARKLYQDLAEYTDDDQLRSLLLALSEEEGKHQRQFEKYYDTYFLK
jgi:rubrerythrin